MASEDDHLHLFCESSDSEEDYTPPPPQKQKQKKQQQNPPPQKMVVNNMAYSRISLNHIQQKTSLLTIAVIYHWRELPQVSSLSLHSFCHDKTRLLSRQNFVGDKSDFSYVLLSRQIRLLSRQKYACRDKHVKIV